MLEGDIILTVASTPLFAGLPPQEAQALVSAGKLRRCAKAQALFSQGEPVTHFYIVVEGAFQLFRANAEGQGKTIDIATRGQGMCEGEILDSCHAHRVSAVAVEDACVLEFPVAWLKQTARSNNVFALNLLSLIAGQAHMAELEAEHQATMSAAQLVACFIQRVCVLHQLDPKGFELPYSKGLVASRLGMEQETFSRALAKLKEHGIVVDGTHVRITDLKRIEQYVCDSCSIAESCQTHRVMEQKNNPLHGMTLKTILEELVARHGWEKLGTLIDIRCFTHDPSINSSLKFLRATPWARAKVEELYLAQKA